MVRYLIGRTLDPLFGIATGVFAYYIYENDPKNSKLRPEGRSLKELVTRYANNERPSFTLYSGPNPLGDRIDRSTNKAV